MSFSSAIRAARTATTEAQNAGRQDTYKAAADMGIKVRKRWLATLDGRTRHEHGMLDGQTVEYGKPFKYGGMKLMFPADSSFGAPPSMIYNCRCTMVYVDELDDILDKGMRRAIDPETGESVLVPWKTFQEWREQKTLVNEYKDVIIKTGAKTRYERNPLWRDDHADIYYEEVRNRAEYSDARRISQNLNDYFTVEEVEQIRLHMFVKEQPRDGTMKRFDTDYEQAEAWQRLIDGKNVRDTDILLLQHELLELTIMKETNCNYEEAHEKANREYNWQRETEL